LPRLRRICAFTAAGVLSRGRRRGVVLGDLARERFEE
jgi:hypothetical protein